MSPGFAVVAGLALAGLCACASAARPHPEATLPDESAVMSRLRADVKVAPEKALALADQAEQRFGDSPAAEERRALSIAALINLQRIGSARSRAYGFLRRYPDGPYSSHVAAMTGVHARPLGPDAGPTRPPCDAQ